MFTVYSIFSGSYEYNWLLAQTNLMVAVVRMMYRRIKLIKHRYYIGESTLKNIFYAFVNVTFFFVVLYGLVRAFIFVNSQIGKF